MSGCFGAGSSDAVVLFYSGTLRRVGIAHHHDLCFCGQCPPCVWKNQNQPVIRGLNGHYFDGDDLRGDSDIFTFMVSPSRAAKTSGGSDADAASRRATSITISATSASVECGS